MQREDCNGGLAWAVLVEGVAWLALLLALDALVTRAGAEERARIAARVEPDLRTITGTLTLSSDPGDPAVAVVDALAALPVPTTDEGLQATFPGAVDRGGLEITSTAPGSWSFTATLPRRYGDIGAIRGFGLFGNGGWYPQPVIAAADLGPADLGPAELGPAAGSSPAPGSLPQVAWEVTLALPPGIAGAVGDVAGSGSLAWSGRGERVSIAVVPHGVVTRLSPGPGPGAPSALPVSTPADAVSLDLLTRGRPRRALRRFLAAQLNTPDFRNSLSANSGSSAPSGVIIEAPLRRRLVQPGVRASYVSDRAWRLTPGFRRFHDVAVMRGVSNALVDIPDPYERDLATAAITARYAQTVAGASAEQSLKWVAWIPLVDKMLHGRHTPFITEILEEALPGDPVRDDLVEVLDPHRPGTAVLAQVADRYGQATAERLAAALIAGRGSAAAAVEAGVDASWLAALRAPAPVEDFVLRARGASTVRSRGRGAASPGARRGPAADVVVTREAPAGAAPEVVMIAVDGQEEPWLAEAGASWASPPEAHRLAVDPDHHVAQTSTAGDTWPVRFTPVFAAWFSRLDLRTLNLDGFVQLALRRQYDTHAIWKLRVFADEQTLVGGDLGYVRMFGPEVDGLRREHQVSAWLTPAVLSARYAPTGGDLAVLGAGLEYTWDNSVARYFPLRGHHLWLGVDAGVSPTSTAGWRAARASGLVYLSPHPRLAFPVEGLAGVAGGTIPHRLVDLGGLDGMRCLPAGEVIGTERLIGRVEARWALVHNAAIPLLLLWGNEISVSLGVEAGVARVTGQTVGAVGATAGLGWQVALLGADPSYARLRAGYPLWTDGIALSTDPRARPVQLVLESETFF